MDTIVGLLLAAGSSRRFGSNKLLHPLPNGEQIVVASARRLATTTDRTIVLVRPQQRELQAALQDIDVEIVEVPDADAGMGITLAAGIRTAPQAAGWVIALGDMPCVREDTLRRVTGALRAGASIVAPYYGGWRGHPVGFTQQWFDALVALDGDEGARVLLRAQEKAITCIDVDDPGCLFDVDRPGDLTELVSAIPKVLSQS